MNNSTNASAKIRWTLLTSVSAAALLAAVYGAGEAQGADNDTDRPPLWIELGAQLEQVNGGDDAFAPPFFSQFNAPITSPAVAEKELPWSFGSEAKISFQPDGSNWVFSATVRYGRADSKGGTQQHTNPGKFYDAVTYKTQEGVRKCCQPFAVTPSKLEFADVQSNHQESHLIVDFQAGKDVGLGLFGQHSTSVFGAGIRFAQFQSKMNISVKARTDLQHYNRYSLPTLSFIHMRYPEKYGLDTRFRTFAMTAGSTRSFHAVGPSISWDASATLAGAPDTAQFTLDWGVNAAILFGRQKAKTKHDTQEHDLTHYNTYYTSSGHRYTNHHHGYVAGYHHNSNSTRSRSVTVPNVGGMAGLSIRFPDAKVSIGYRADLFVGAMDAGWDSRKSENRSFYGPFASISIGLGG